MWLKYVLSDCWLFEKFVINIPLKIDRFLSLELKENNILSLVVEYYFLPIVWKILWLWEMAQNLKVWIFIALNGGKG